MGETSARLHGEEEHDATGYVRSRGGIGIRNRVLVLPSVICSHVVADRIAATVDRAVSTPHDHGCAQIGDDKDQTARTFAGLASNPNVSGAVVVGLGCETLQSEGVAAEVQARDVPVEETSIQAAGGTEACFEDGVAAAARLAATSSGSRARIDLSELTLGVVGSDLHRSSLERADPLVGSLVETVVEAGGRVVVAGIDRVIPHVDSVSKCTSGDEAAARLQQLSDQHHTPWATPVQHSAQNLDYQDISRLWADLPIEDVIAYGDTARQDSGVALVEASSSFAEATTALAAAGSQIVIHVTADGIPAGHPIVPVVKVTGSEDTYAALEGDLDIHGGSTSSEEAERLLTAFLGGAPTCAEQHGVTAFGIARTGPSM